MSEQYACGQYVGIDLHRRRSVIVRMSKSGELLGTVRIVNDVDRLRAVLARAGESPEVVLEATYGWYWAADAVAAAGASVHLAHPLGVKAFEYRRVRLAAHRRRGERQGSPDATRARHGGGNAEHVRTSVARLGGSRAGRRRPRSRLDCTGSDRQECGASTTALTTRPASASGRSSYKRCYDLCMADTITFRPDEDAQRALTALTADGTSVSRAVRSALIEAAKAQAARMLRAEASELAADELDRAEAAQVLRDMETLRAW